METYFEMALQHATKKYGDVVEITQGHANAAWEEYQKEATAFEGLQTSVLVHTAKTGEVKQVLTNAFPNARIWDGVWQGHVIMPSEDISSEQAEKVIRSVQWRPYRLVSAPRKVPFWHDSYKRYELCEPQMIDVALWCDVISPNLQGDNAFAFTSVFYDGSEVGHSAHVCRHMYVGKDGTFAYFKQASSHEEIPHMAISVEEEEMPERIKKIHRCYIKARCIGNIFKLAIGD